MAGERKSTGEGPREERTGYRSGDPRFRPPDPETSPGRSTASAPRCDLCGAEMLEIHCRLVCLQCGYQRDCSDP